VADGCVGPGVEHGSSGIDLRVLSHTYRAAYRQDVSLSITWGPRGYDDEGGPPSETWASCYPDKKGVRNEYLDVFGAGMLKDRHPLVAVDGGRARIRRPDQKLVGDQVVRFWLSRPLTRLGHWSPLSRAVTIESALMSITWNGAGL
jgi:hypothetical protein